MLVDSLLASLDRQLSCLPPCLQARRCTSAHLTLSKRYRAPFATHRKAEAAQQGVQSVAKRKQCHRKDAIYQDRTGDLTVNSRAL